MPAVDTSLRLPEGEYFPSTTAKSGICIHHTVGGTARSTYDWWLQDRARSGGRRRVGTAFLIARDGTVHEVFDRRAWAYQFGLPWALEKKLAFEKRFIGIELANLGALMESDGELYCFDRVLPQNRVPRDRAFDFGRPWRGYRYWARYTNAQTAALIELIDELCEEFGIPRRVPAGFLDFYGEELEDFEGVIGHTMVRSDKTDPLPDESFWRAVAHACGLERTTVGGLGEPVAEASDETAAAGPMTDTQRLELFDHNARQINEMNQAAAGLVMALVDELERDGRNTFIRLSDPAQGGHTIRYEFVEGDPDLVPLAARSLGFESWEDGVLEVRHG